MKNKASLAVLLAAALIFVSGAMEVIFGSGNTPGTVSDPVVTKSYVDEQIAALKAGLSSSSGAFEVINLKAGQQLIAASGAEIILRSGTATAIGGAGGGLSDVTGGIDLATGSKVVKNHLIIVPRDDGRGINCTGECWIMIKGGYTVK